MAGTTTMPASVAFAAIDLERARLRELFAGVYRLDGTIDEAALAGFAAQLGVHAPTNR